MLKCSYRDDVTHDSHLESLVYGDLLHEDDVAQTAALAKCPHAVDARLLLDRQADEDVQVVMVDVNHLISGC